VAATVLGLRAAGLLPDRWLLSMMVLLSVSISYGLALVISNENSLATLVNGVSQPISLLAGVLIPLSVAPLWVQNVALWNPFAWGTNAMRAAFAGQLGDSVVWQASLILAVLAVISVLLSSRLFSRSLA
jgi:ABC-2 type transport system permease protein